jgi:hypothetical protein
MRSLWRPESGKNALASTQALVSQSSLARTVTSKSYRSLLGALERIGRKTAQCVVDLRRGSSHGVLLSEQRTRAGSTRLDGAMHPHEG